MTTEQAPQRSSATVPLAPPRLRGMVLRFRHRGLGVLASALCIGAACAPSSSAPQDSPTLDALDALDGIVTGASAADAEIPTPEPKVAARAREAKGAAHYLLGVIGRDGKPVCEDDKLTWAQLHFDAGLTHLVGDDNAFRRLLRQPVAITGSPRPELKTPFASGHHPCVAAQMRSDWVPRPDGYLSERSGRDDLGGFEAHEVRALTPAELSVRLNGEQLEVEFQNPLPIAIENLSIVVFYEGCYGKPGGDERAATAVSLAVGERTRFVAPTVTRGARGRLGRVREHVARSVGLRVVAPQVFGDFELPLASLGVTVPCTEH